MSEFETDNLEDKLAATLLDPDFERLELMMREPNLFRALGIEREEIRHSNFFAYLLDPQGSHGLRDIVLRKFLRDVFSDQRAEGRSLFDADLLNLSQVEVRREWKNIDVLVDLPEDVVVVENKVDSTEHSDQLRRYRVTINTEFPSKRKHFVYLTPFGNDATDIEDRNIYINYSYAQIAELLENILHLYGDSIGPKVKYFLEDYLSTIKQELLMNDKLNELAVKIYKAHKPALDFILENRPDPASILYPFFENELKQQGFEIGSRNKGYVRFSSKDLAERLPKVGQGWPSKEVFLVEIDYFWSDRNAIAKAVIAPGDKDLGDTILESVKGLPLYRKPDGKKWLVFYMKKLKFVASEVINEDEQEIRKKVSAIVSAISSDANEIFAAISASLTG